MNNLGDRLKGMAGKLFKKYWNERWLKNPVFNNLAQAIEIVWDLEQIPIVIDYITKIKSDPEIVKPTQNSGEGVGAVEAPRGTLYHHYRVENGLVSDANFIIPTGQSLDDCEKYMKKAVEEMLSQNAPDDLIRLQCEIIARAYDPYISCSTHLVTIQHDDR
ncbi:nickel-dependent hydrogenase large subunit [bacterium]|nr:nickel-dependent hydrogenase large subunit [bacterium]